VQERNQDLTAQNEAYEDELVRIRQERQALAQELERLAMRNQDLNLNLEAQGEEAQRLRQRLAALEALEKEVSQRNRIYASVIDQFKSLIDAGQLQVSIVDGRMVINLPQDILFDSGSAKLSPQGTETLQEVARVLAEINREFQVEGHTDNVPIHSQRFPSNWELSSARALSVVHLLVGNGVNPDKLSGAGYGEHQPNASNEDKEGRKLNRRIEIVMLPNLDVIADTQVSGEVTPQSTADNR
jgi:chemotaxis protein MotB